MALEKHDVEARDLDGGVVGMTCVSDEDGAEGTSPESTSPTHEQTSSELVKRTGKAIGDRDGENEEDQSEENESNNDPSEDAKSDASSEDSWSDETPPLNLNYEALKHTVDHFLTGSHGTCVNITTMRRGSFHEIRVLHFADGWSCTARFTRDYEMLQKTESELATIEYVRRSTTIPVPEIYFVNHNENHVVGTAFVIMERMAGEQLRFIWHDLSLEHKLGLVSQVADIVGQLADQKFDRIGSLKADGTLGPLIHQNDDTQPMGEQPFTSTIDWFFAFLKDDDLDRAETARKLYPEIREELRSFFEKNADNPNLHAPYGLLHVDFQYQNMLVIHEDKTVPPKISAIIDWDWSHTAPLETIWEYPVFITDVDFREEEYADNKVLRKHYVASLMQRFPENLPERKLVKQCFRDKCFTLNGFYRILMRRWDDDCEGAIVNSYLRSVRGVDNDSLAPYGGRWDWVMDSDLDDSDVESEDDEATSGDLDEESSNGLHEREGAL